MKLLTYEKAFTIAELILAMSLFAFIAMILMPSLVTDSKDKILATSLEKNHIYMNDTFKSVQLLQAQGKISPGAVDADKFLQTVVLTSKCIGLNSKGVVLTDNKFTQYLPQNYKTIPENIIPLNQFQYKNYAWQGETIMLKNYILISKYTNDNIDYIVTDVNGPKPPNITGKDIFFYIIGNNAILEATDKTTLGGQPNPNPNPNNLAFAGHDEVGESEHESGDVEQDQEAQPEQKNENIGQGQGDTPSQKDSAVGQDQSEESLSETYTGLYNDMYYVNGSPGTGVYNNIYYANGSKGTGLYKGTYYDNGSPGTGLYKGIIYYKDGSLGTGVYNNIYYVNGSKGTGLYKGTYYVNGSPGTGSYQNNYYINGEKFNRGIDKNEDAKNFAKLKGISIKQAQSELAKIYGK